ncbi:MAG: superoxide dismutase family protein [Pseudoxanthomonas sp.]
MRFVHSTLFLATVLALGACSKPADPVAPAAEAPAPTAEAPAPTETAAPAAGGTAKATLKATEGNALAGELSFMTMDNMVHVTGTITGLAPNSKHGFHIHEKGDCSAPDGASAGGHFNPGSSDHGQVSAEPHHGGDMDNITADAEGKATVDGMLSSNVNIGKGDAFDIVGKGLIVHADQDDYKTQPTGNAGGRQACAVIEAVQ